MFVDHAAALWFDRKWKMSAELTPLTTNSDFPLCRQPLPADQGRTQAGRTDSLPQGSEPQYLEAVVGGVNGRCLWAGWGVAGIALVYSETQECASYINIFHFYADVSNGWDVAF
jgi:hypothetical protein